MRRWSTIQGEPSQLERSALADTLEPMCTYAFSFDPGHDWPFVIAGNRDERQDRAWAAPAAHWPDREGVVGGLDQLGGGTWAGINQHGVVACLLNRWDTLGPGAGKRSRGEIVLDALDFADARDAAEALADLSPDAYLGFNLILADNRDCFWLHLRAGSAVQVKAVRRGIHLITHGDLNEMATRRIARYLPQFQALGPPEMPDKIDSWSHWRMLLTDRSLDPSDDPKSGLLVEMPEMNFGTSSQRFFALRSIETVARAGEVGVYFFASPHKPLTRVL